MLLVILLREIQEKTTVLLYMNKKIQKENIELVSFV